MKILYIAHRIPYPPNKGEKIRSFNEIKYLSRSHDIHLACLADNFGDLKYIEDLKKYCTMVNIVPINPKFAKVKSTFYILTNKPLSISYFYSKKLQRIVDHLLLTNNYDIILCFSSPMAEYIFRAPAQSRWPINHKEKSLTNNHQSKTGDQITKLIMDFVDVDSDKWIQYSKFTKFPFSWLYRLEARRLAKYEQKIGEKFNYSFFVSTREADFFQKQNPCIRNVKAISNGIDLGYFNPDLFDSSRYAAEIHKPNQRLLSDNQQPILLFTGTMDYFANIDGVRWFVEEIFPLIKRQLSGIKFYIVGSKPTKEVMALGKNKDIVVTGFVNDIREYLIKAVVFVAPLRIARGIQNKILEAMAMGVPVVATPQAFEGIEAEPDNDLFVEGIPENFANQVVKLLIDRNINEQLKHNARKLIEKKYSWDRNIKILDEIISNPSIH